MTCNNNNNNIYTNLFKSDNVHFNHFNQISNCGVQRQINEWQVFVLNTMADTVYASKYYNNN